MVPNYDILRGTMVAMATKCLKRRKSLELPPSALTTFYKSSQKCSLGGPLLDSYISIWFMYPIKNIDCNDNQMLKTWKIFTSLYKPSSQKILRQSLPNFAEMFL